MLKPRRRVPARRPQEAQAPVSFTLDTYSHVMPGKQPEAAKVFMDLGEGEESASLGAGRPDDREAS